MAGGTTYSIQATFAPVTFVGPTGATIDMTTDAIVIVSAGVGGTVSPPPGTYALASASSLNLQATPDSGWTFDHWVIAGTPMNHGVYSFTDTPTNNPYNVDHGYGNTYSYMAVFSPVSTSTTPTPTINEFSTASAAILTAILAIALSLQHTYSLKKLKSKNPSLFFLFLTLLPKLD